jgi:hypothetical protein
MLQAEEVVVRFLLVHHVEEARLDDTTDDSGDEQLQRWFDETLARGVLVDGSRLRPASDGANVRVRAGELLVSEGPFAESAEQIAGYDLIECANLADAVDVASRHPTTRIGRIEVRPLLEAPTPGASPWPADTVVA